MNGKEITIQKIIEDSTAFNNGNGLIAPIGVNSDGKIEYVDYSKINNLLVCGTTGSGKTTFVRTLIASLISTHKPDSVKLCIFDSRRTDYIEFSNIPHLMLPIITDTKNSCGMISWVLGEAQKRLRLLKEETVEFNFPEIFVILDDYAQVAQEPELQERLCELLQIAHRVKIHIVIVTSIALARIISTELKVHIPHRIAFFLPERRNSQVVIDQNGAETLEMPGQFIAKFNSKTKTYCSIELSDEEIIKVCELYKPEDIDEEAVTSVINNPAELESHAGKVIAPHLSKDDDLYDKAVDIAIEAGMVSATLLQRKLKIGYAPASRLIDKLEENGIIGPYEGGKPRKVFVNVESLENTIFSKKNNIAWSVPHSNIEEEIQFWQDVDKLITENKILQAMVLLKIGMYKHFDFNKIQEKVKLLQPQLNDTVFFFEDASCRLNPMQLFATKGKLILTGTNLLFESQTQNFNIKLLNIVGFEAVENVLFAGETFGRTEPNCIKVTYRDVEKNVIKNIDIQIHEAKNNVSVLNSLLRDLKFCQTF